MGEVPMLSMRVQLYFEPEIGALMCAAAVATAAAAVSANARRTPFLRSAHSQAPISHTATMRIGFSIVYTCAVILSTQKTSAPITATSQCAHRPRSNFSRADKPLSASAAVTSAGANHSFCHPIQAAGKICQAMALRVHHII